MVTLNQVLESVRLLKMQKIRLGWRTYLRNPAENRQARKKDLRLTRNRWQKFRPPSRTLVKTRIQTGSLAPVPYAALCTTFSLVEMTTKRLEISAHCSLFLQQVLRLTPGDLLPTVQLMINKLAADYAGIELGIGESLIMKAIGESTGRSLSVIKSDQHEIGDLGLVAAKSRSNQP